MSFFLLTGERKMGRGLEILGQTDFIIIVDSDDPPRVVRMIGKHE